MADFENVLTNFNLFVHNIKKWSNMLQKSCGVHTARFLKYVWPFFKIMDERFMSKNITKRESFCYYEVGNFHHKKQHIFY